MDMTSLCTGETDTLTVTDDLVKECAFVTNIDDISTDIVYKAYVDRYFVLVCQAQGETGAGVMVVNQLPNVGGFAAGSFSFSIVRDCHGFMDAAKNIGLQLKLDKPLHVYLCLQHYKTETINNFVQTLLKKL